MAGTHTSRGNLYKSAADGNDSVNVVTDLNNNMDRLDALLGWRPVTSGTMPASAFQGAALFQTDTGRAYINQGAGGSAATAYKQVMVEGSTFAANISLASSANQINIGTSPSTASFAARLFSSGGNILSGIVGSDVSSRFTITAAGTHSWGDGTTQDTNLYRAAANLLGTDDSLQVGQNLTVSGSSTLDDAIIGGNLIVNGAIVRPQLHTATTVANTTSEAALQTVTIPAGDASIGATYRIRMFGTAAVTGTPTITFRTRIGGVSGTQVVSMGTITARSGMTDGYWELDALLTCVTTGASATWSGVVKVGHNFLTGVGTYTTLGPIVTASVTRDSTSAQDFVVSVQFSAASPSNTITARGSESGRVA